MTADVSFRLGSGLLKAAIFVVGLLLLFTMGCQRTPPATDTARLPDAFGTISGTIRVPQGTRSVGGRVVEVINTETGERQRLTTSNVGGFTFKVKPGKHRVQVELREGESIVKQPGIMNVNRTGTDAHADFIIGTVPAARPPSAIKQGDPGLGPPIV
jgi:hypothetical protein